MESVTTPNGVDVDAIMESFNKVKPSSEEVKPSGEKVRALGEKVRTSLKNPLACLAEVKSTLQNAESKC